MAGVTSPRGGADYSTPTAGAENIREKNDQALPFPADSGGYIHLLQSLPPSETWFPLGKSPLPWGTIWLKRRNGVQGRDRCTQLNEAFGVPLGQMFSGRIHEILIDHAPSESSSTPTPQLLLYISVMSCCTFGEELLPFFMRSSTCPAALLWPNPSYRPTGKEGRWAKVLRGHLLSCRAEFSVLSSSMGEFSFLLRTVDHFSRWREFRWV